MRHHLVRLFRRAIERHRVIGVLMLGEWLLRVRPIDGAGRSVDEMLHVVVPAALQDIEESGDVAVDVGVRVFHRIAHSGLGGEVDDPPRAPLAKEAGHLCAIGDVEPDKLEPVEVAELLKARLLQLRIVVGIEIVDSHDGVAALEEPFRDVVADESGRAGDENQNSAMLSCAPPCPSMCWSPAGPVSSARTWWTPTWSEGGASQRSTTSRRATGRSEDHTSELQSHSDH